MDNNYADRSRILPSLTTAYNIVAARFRLLADSSAGDSPGHFLAQRPRVIVASLTSKHNKI